MIARAGITLAQLAKMRRHKSFTKKNKPLFEMPKKTGWRKSAFGNTFPNYSRYDLALDAGALGVGVGIGAVIRGNKKKKEKKS